MSQFNMMKRPGIDYGRDNIRNIFFRIFVPTLLGMVFNSLIALIDGVIVGRGVGYVGIAAVNIISPVYLFTTGLGLMFGIGSSVAIGLCLSNKHTAEANSIMSQTFMVSSIVILISAVFAFVFDIELVSLLGSSAFIQKMSAEYLRYILPGMFFLLWQSVGMLLIRLDGSPKYAMLCNIIPAVVNIGLDYIMVFPLGMGVKGAALATSISLTIGGLMSVIYFLKSSYVLKFAFEVRNLTKHMRNIMSIGSSAFLTEMAMAIMIFTGNTVFMAYFSEAGVAAFGIACYIFPIIFMIGNSVAQSAQPIISFNYGICSTSRVRQTFNYSIIMAIVCGIFAGWAISFFSTDIIRLFISLDSVAGIIAQRGLPIFSICAVFFSLNIAIIGYFQSINRPYVALILTALRGIIFIVPLFFILAKLFPSWGMWAAIPVSELLTCIIGVIIFNASKKQQAVL